MSMMNGLPPAALWTIHRGQLGGRGQSPRLWARWKDANLSPDGASNGYMIGDDFLNFGEIAPGANGTTTYGLAGGTSLNLGYGVYVDSGATSSSIKQQADTFGGTIKIATPATDNLQAILQGGGGTGGILDIDDLNNPNLQIFEARFKVGQISNQYDAFIGFADPGLCSAGGVFSTSDALAAANNFLGFQILTGAGATIKFIYQAASQVQQLPFTLSTALVANTWYKVGFVYNPHTIASKRFTVMLNNDQGTVTQTVPVPSSGPVIGAANDSNTLSATQLQAATFPSATFLTPTFALMNNGANINSLSLDWWNLAGAGQLGGNGEEGGPE